VAYPVEARLVHGLHDKAGAMKEPFCKLCKHNHNGLDHVWDDMVVEPVKPKVVEKVVDRTSRHGQYADIEKRKAYQREYYLQHKKAKE
jgi:hypothetical protein